MKINFQKPIEKQQPIKAATKVKCDNCHKEFKIRQKIVKTEKLDNDVKRTYFKCPHCKKEYIISYTDDEFRANIQEITNIFKKLRDNGNQLTDEEIKELIDKKDRLVKISKDISQKYRGIYERGEG